MYAHVIFKNLLTSIYNKLHSCATLSHFWTAVAVAAVSPCNGHSGEFVLDIPVCVHICIYVGVTHFALAALCALLWIMSTKPFILICSQPA